VSDEIKTNNILVVDDSPTMRRMVITSLGTLGRVKSTQAGSGLEAIERLAIEPVDLMVLDLNITTYFSIQFRGVNDVGFGDYVEGFSATRLVGEPQANLPGCAAMDDFTRELGDPQEGQLQAALTHLQTGACPVMPLQKAHSGAPVASWDAIDSPLALRKPAPAPWRDNRILR
jgi:CheY-like chemotaxis protein